MFNFLFLVLVAMSEPDFEFIEKHLKNINFGRDKEWKSSLPLDELFNLEEKLLFDPYISFQEKTVLVQQEINSLLSENEHLKTKHLCKYCSKEFKKVGKSLLNHQAVCLFNPENAKSLKLSAFKDKVLRSLTNKPQPISYDTLLLSKLPFFLLKAL